MIHEEIRDPKEEDDDGICKWSFDTSPKPQNTHFSHTTDEISHLLLVFGVLH